MPISSVRDIGSALKVILWTLLRIRQPNAIQKKGSVWHSNNVDLYLENGNNILSQEGVTQGDNAAMAMYALSTRPLIQALSKETANDEVKQV